MDVILDLIIAIGAILILVTVFVMITLATTRRALQPRDDYPLASEDEFRSLDRRYREAGE